MPAALSSSPPSTTHSDGDADGDADADDDGTDLAIWLSGECPRMFELFALWLSKPPAFRTCVETAIATLPKQGRRSRALHWSLVRLHLFAAAVAIPALQDYALDALQDLYLHCDWTCRRTSSASCTSSATPPPPSGCASGLSPCWLGRWPTARRR